VLVEVVGGLAVVDACTCVVLVVEVAPSVLDDEAVVTVVVVLAGPVVVVVVVEVVVVYGEATTVTVMA
jgi:hypothetical protein